MPIGFHPLQLVAILAITLLIFGPKRLPEMGASIGKTIKEFQKGMKELQTPKEEPAATNLASIASTHAETVKSGVNTETKFD